jgi:hypothetical protein
MLLADLGADIVAIDRAGATTVPDREVRESGLEIIGRGSRRVTLDLKDEEDLMGTDQRVLNGNLDSWAGGWSPSRQPVSTVHTWSGCRVLKLDRAPAGW